MTCNLTTEMRRRGGQARQQRPDAREHQRRAGRRSAQVQDMRALGRLGFEATAARYGHNFAFDRARRWRLEHPSSLEQQVMRILDENWIDYEREAQVLGDQVPIAVDFYLAEHNLSSRSTAKCTPIHSSTRMATGGLASACAASDSSAPASRSWSSTIGTYRNQGALFAN